MDILQPRIVNDLIPVILQSSDHWWSRDLARLALVSSAWLFCVRRQLYASPVVQSFSSCFLLARTLSENTFPSSLVRGIDLRPMVGDEVRECRESNETLMASIRFILALDGLETITLGGELSVRAERFLHILTSPDTVTSLHIDGYSNKNSLCRRPSLEWDETMAFKFPNLRKLRLSNLDLEVIYPSIPFELQVTDLLLDNVQLTGGHIIHLLHETTSLKHLFVFTSNTVEFDEQIRFMLDSYAIESLHYETTGDVPPSQTIFSAQCLSLRTLYLSGMYVDLGTLNSIDQCCPNVAGLSVLGRMVKLTPREWATFIGSGALPALRDLGVPWGTNNPPFRRWTAASEATVREASAVRNVQLSSGL